MSVVWFRHRNHKHNIVSELCDNWGSLQRLPAASSHEKSLPERFYIVQCFCNSLPWASYKNLSSVSSLPVTVITTTIFAVTGQYWNISSGFSTRTPPSGAESRSPDIRNLEVEHNMLRLERNILYCFISITMEISTSGENSWRNSTLNKKYPRLIILRPLSCSSQAVDVSVLLHAFTVLHLVFFFLVDAFLSASRCDSISPVFFNGKKFPITTIAKLHNLRWAQTSLL